MTPGPTLGVLLTSIDFATLAPADRVEVLRARHRQVSHDQAGLLADMYGIAEAVRAAGCGMRGGQGAIGEVSAALTISARRAELDLDLACVLIGHLPSVFAALHAGQVCWAKAAAFSDWLADLTVEQATTICLDLLPVAPRLTPAQLRERLRRRVLDIDPDHARRRYRDAVRDRGVVAFLDDNGTMTISATGLPADEAARACERLDNLARAVKRAGHRGFMNQIQADVFLGVLSGRFNHMTEAEIIAALLAQHRCEDTDENLAQPDYPTRADQAEGPELADLGESDSHAMTADQPKTDQTKPTPWAADKPGEFVPFGLEIKVGLLTLLGLDQRCAEFTGYGFVPAHIARRTVSNQTRGGQWRFAVTNDHGQLVFDGITTRRPRTDTTTGPPDRCRNGIVELQISTTELSALTAHDHHGWGRVITDIADQYRHHRYTDPPNPTPITTVTTLARQHRRDKARLLRGAAARHVHIRDRTCVFPGCRRPARQSQLDHTIDHAHGGPTTANNAGPLCLTHHQWKSLRWWRLTQPQPGHFRWTSPLGCLYYTRSEPIRLPTIPTQSGPPTHSAAHSLRELAPFSWRSGPTLRRRRRDGHRRIPRCPRSRCRSTPNLAAARCRRGRWRPMHGLLRR